MKKLLLTSQKFKGQIEVIYDLENMLMVMDFQNVTLSEIQMSYFTQRVPAIYNPSTFRDSFESKNLKVLSEDFKVEFEKFWIKYGKKINKARVIKVWDSLTEENRARAYLGLNKYNAYLAEKNWRTKLDPENYLKNKSWDNEWQ